MCLVLKVSLFFIISMEALASDCNINIGGGGRVDFGRIDRPGSNATAEAGGLYALGMRSVALTVSCAEDGKLGLSIRGEALDRNFRFSTRGQLHITANNALLDGRNVQLSTLSANGSEVTGVQPFVSLKPGDTLIPVVNAVHAKGAVWSMILEVRPSLPLADMRRGDAQSLQHYFSFEVRQL